MEQDLQLIAQHAEQGAKLRLEFFNIHNQQVRQAAKSMALCLAKGGKILLAGNGGSAADAQHWAAELVNRFILDRPPLAAIALSTDSSVLTAIGNDFGFEFVFSKQIQALGKEGDVFLAISTSGNSPNILEALQVARAQGLKTIGFSGGGHGKMENLCDIMLAVPHKSTPLVQEIHATIGHLLCALVDHYLFENFAALESMLEA